MTMKYLQYIRKVLKYRAHCKTSTSLVPLAPNFAWPVSSHRTTANLGLEFYCSKRELHLCSASTNYCLQWHQQSVRDCNFFMDRCAAITYPLSHSPLFGKTTVTVRGYAKGKDIKKTAKGKKNIKVNDAQLSEIIPLETLKSQFQKPIDKLKEEFIKNISLRSTTGSIESLPISLDGKDYVLQELAQIIRKDSKTVIINMATFPQAITIALQALEKSGMNLNPQQDGTTLYIPIPKITKEHRENLSKNAKTLFLKCRDSIKDVQNKFVKSMKHNDSVSKDDAYSAQEQIISLADQYVEAAQKMLDAKQAELLL